MEHDNLDSDVGGYCSDIPPGTESMLLKSDGDGSSMGPERRHKKRPGKRQRQRRQKKMVVLGSIPEEPEMGSSGTPKRARDISGNTPEANAKKTRTYAQVTADSSVRKFCIRDNNPSTTLNEVKPHWVISEGDEPAHVRICEVKRFRSSNDGMLRCGQRIYLQMQ